MNAQKANHLENLWDRILSRDESLIQEAFSELDKSEREIIISHLKRMANEPGWHDEQRKSAQAALQSILID